MQPPDPGSPREPAPSREPTPSRETTPSREPTPPRSTLPLRLLSSSSFRLAIVYMTVFGLSVTGLLAFIYASTAGYMASQTDETIRAEVEGLAERYRANGLEGLIDAIEERIRRNPGRRSVYLLTDTADRRVVGNLDRWPSGAPDADGWLVFELAQVVDGEVESHAARARPFTLVGRFRLLVGRDVHDLEATRNLIVRTLAWGLAITVMLTLLGGFLMARSTIRRIESINATGRRIMRGDLTQRIPTGGSGDDFDQLADNLNAMLDRIEELMEDVRRVSDNIAHDLRTPLTRLRSRLETLRGGRGEIDPEIERALEDADALLSTFNSLLRIARIESGGRRAGFAEVDLESLLGDVVELYEPVAEAHGQRLGLDLATPATVEGDRNLLFQALANLVDNALKYTPEGGSVTVYLGHEDDAPLVAVRDTGPGIPAAERDNVVKRFYRLERSRTTPGSGLGLSLVLAVARLHDAELSLDDGQPGLLARLTFPATRRRRDALATSAEKEPERGSSTPPPAESGR
jgi:signal transduction histidine kinase